MQELKCEYNDTSLATFKKYQRNVLYITLLLYMQLGKTLLCIDLLTFVEIFFFFKMNKMLTDYFFVDLKKKKSN